MCASNASVINFYSMRHKDLTRKKGSGKIEKFGIVYYRKKKKKSVIILPSFPCVLLKVSLRFTKGVVPPMSFDDELR